MHTMSTFAELTQENEHLRWLLDEQRQQIRDLEMDATLTLPQQVAHEVPPMTRERAAQIAAKTGVSTRTIYRQLKSGRLPPADILEEVS